MSESVSSSLSVSSSVSVSELFRNGFVKLTVFNQVLDENGYLAAGDGQLFGIVVANADYSRAILLKHGESEEITLPKGEYTVSVDTGALNGEYEYIALVTPDGLVDTAYVVDFSDADEANVTVVNKKAGNSTIAGGNVNVVKYVIDNGTILAEDPSATFQINVAGKQVVTVVDDGSQLDPMGEAGEQAAGATGASEMAAAGAESEIAQTADVAAETAGANEMADTADTAGAPEAPDATDGTDGASDGPESRMPEQAEVGESAGSEATPNYIAVVGANEAAGEAAIEPNDAINGTETSGTAASGTAASGNDGGADAAGSAIMESLAEVEQDFSESADVAQGGSRAFSTSRGAFTVTETIGQNSGYALEGIFNIESFAGITGAGAEALSVEVGDGRGAAVVVFNKATAIEAPEPIDEIEPNVPLDENEGTESEPTVEIPAGTAGTGSASMSGSASIQPNAMLEYIADDFNPLAAFVTDHIQYIYGDPEGTVRPDSDITRAETAMIIFRLLANKGKDRAVPSPFADVAAGQWYTQAVDYLAYAGIIDGYPDGTFKPDAPISRAEFTKMIAGFDKLEQSSGDLFSDIAGNWAAGYINSAAASGWVHGYPDGTFKPLNKLTRAETVSLINAKLQRKVEPENIPDWAPSFTDLDKSHWAYSDIIEAAVTHTYQYGDDGAEIWDNPASSEQAGDSQQPDGQEGGDQPAEGQATGDGPQPSGQEGSDQPAAGQEAAE
jgi:hypothetical protein